LHLIEGPFDPFSDAAQPAIKGRWSLLTLILPFRLPDPDAAPLLPLPLPIVIDHPLVRQHIPLPEHHQHRIRGLAFIRIGRDQFVRDRETFHRGEEHSFIPPIMQIPTHTHAIGGGPGNITVGVGPLTADHGDRLRVEQTLAFQEAPHILAPLLPQFLDDQSERPRATVKLALINQFRKQIPIIGPHVPQKLRFPGRGKKIHRQEQRHHFAIAESGFGPAFPLESRGDMRLIPVIHKVIDDGQ